MGVNNRQKEKEVSFIKIWLKKVKPLFKFKLFWLKIKKNYLFNLVIYILTTCCNVFKGNKYLENK